jgi:glyoxylase-like metal-dependent hydrolase (beta-lactamase superfamily II)
MNMNISKHLNTGRKNLAAIALAIGSTLPLAATLVAPDAEAAAPQVRTQAPGYYRMMLGDFEVTAISDGTVTIPLDKLLRHVSLPEMKHLLSRGNLRTQAETSINTFLINTGTQLVLVDTGAGRLFGPSAGGQLVQNLRAAGYRPEDIDVVLLTHIHGDHSGGLTIDGKAVFPNAVIRVDRHESEFWLDAGNEKTVDPAERHSFADAAASLAPYLASGRIQPFESGSELMPGIKAVPAPGHTPGHSLYEIESRGQKLVIWGDLIHAKDIQLSRPGVTVQYDVSEAGAAAQRKKILVAAARSDAWVAAAHIAFPGIGRIRQEGSGRYAWAPANYSLAGLGAGEHVAKASDSVAKK